MIGRCESAAVANTAVESGRSSAWGRVGRHVGGWTLIAFGVIGFLIPFFPTTLLALAGLALIAPEVPWAQRTLDWGRQKIKS